MRRASFGPPRAAPRTDKRYARACSIAREHPLRALPGPTGKLGAESLDHVIRTHQERVGNLDPEGFRSLEVDDQVELGGLLDRQVAGPRALEDLVDEARGAPVQVFEVGAISHEAADVREASRRIDGGDTIVDRLGGDSGHVRRQYEVTQK